MIGIFSAGINGSGSLTKSVGVPVLLIWSCMDLSCDINRVKLRSQAAIEQQFKKKKKIKEKKRAKELNKIC